MRLNYLYKRSPLSSFVGVVVIVTVNFVVVYVVVVGVVVVVVFVVNVFVVGVMLSVVRFVVVVHAIVVGDVVVVLGVVVVVVVHVVVVGVTSLSSFRCRSSSGAWVLPYCRLLLVHSYPSSFPPVVKTLYILGFGATHETTFEIAMIPITVFS